MTAPGFHVVTAATVLRWVSAALALLLHFLLSPGCKASVLRASVMVLSSSV
jgi:hypothetical protein